MALTFKQRLLAREMLVGTWIKTPSAIVCEVLAQTPLDCLALDAEHAPFDRRDIDACLMATRANHMPCFVRIPKFAPEYILNALDCGADGVIVPHICSAAQAADAVKLSHYGRSGRGFAGSSRAAGYTTKSMANHLADSAACTCTILQIEDVEGVENIDAISAVPGIDCLFVGRIDLTVAYGATSPDDQIVVAAVEKICAAGMLHNKPVGMFLSRVEDVPMWRSKGASLFLLSSDHGFLLCGAKQLAQAVKG